MARSRNIKPGFFKNEELGEMEPLARLLFAGLWTLADKEGRLEYRPKRIKAEVLPYDDVDVCMLLEQLMHAGFIRRYQVMHGDYIQVANWHKHQMPHHREVASELPAPPGHSPQHVDVVRVAKQEPCMSDARTVHEPCIDDACSNQVASCPTDSLLLIPDSLNLIPDSLNPPPSSSPPDGGEGLMGEQQEVESDEPEEPKLPGETAEPPNLAAVFREFMAEWNTLECVRTSVAANATRLKSFRARMRRKVCGVSWLEAFRQHAKPKFPLKLCQDNDGWKPDIDWILRDGTLESIIEGKYDWRKDHGTHKTAAVGPGQVFRDGASGGPDVGSMY